MMRIISLAVGVALLFGLVCQSNAQTELEVSFPAEISTGVISYPQISTLGSWDTPCENGSYAIYWNGSVDWGDGRVSGWDSDSGGVSMDPHAYDIPGRYVVKASRSWSLLPYDEYGYPSPGSGDCVMSTGTHQARTVVEVVPGTSDPANGYLGVFADEDGLVCAQPVAPVTEMFVVATLGGESLVGVGGAEFRVEGTGGLILSTSAMPGWIAFGNPLSDGTTMAHACIQEQGSRVAMLRILAFSENGEAAGNVFVRPHRSPSNPHSLGLTLTICDAPVFTAIATESWHAALVGSEVMELCSPVATAVDSRSWGNVKGLYR